jgi:hypothetical protein
MNQHDQQKNRINDAGVSDLSQPLYLFEPTDAYLRLDEKEQLLNFLATWKDKDLTDEQAVDQLTILTAKATPANNAQAAHQMQMELLTYAEKLVEKIIDSKVTSYNYPMQFLNTHQVCS